MRLSKSHIEQINAKYPIELPGPDLFRLPEKVLQFGTGVFLRGLIDYIIDKSNKEGIFNGRVLAVKSTDIGSVNDFKEQDCLYTLIMRGLDGTVNREEIVVCSSISRVVSAKEEWETVLQSAYNSDLQVVVSNTTEAGISLLIDEDIYASPPTSYPGKLLRFLLERYKAFNGSREMGLVVIPTELIPDNGIKLKSIVNELAERNDLEEDFILWLNKANDFCNSLVDRIVSGKPPEEERPELENYLGYEDRLMEISETFALWAIESSRSKTHDRLSFSKVHSQIFIVPHIDKFRELKLRLLNGSHNLSCAVGVIAGFKLVRDAMKNRAFNHFMRNLVLYEIAPAVVSSDISLEEAAEFGEKVLERYENPHIAFDWLDICVQDTAKIRIRAVPIVVQHYKKYGAVPDTICLCFSAYILFMKSRFVDGLYFGEAGGRRYEIADEYAGILFQKWSDCTGMALVESVLADDRLWGTDLSKFERFPEKVFFYLEKLADNGVFDAFELIETSSP